MDVLKATVPVVWRHDVEQVSNAVLSCEGQVGWRGGAGGRRAQEQQASKEQKHWTGLCRQAGGEAAS